MARVRTKVSFLKSLTESCMFCRSKPMRDLANPSDLKSLNFSFKYCDTLNWSALEDECFVFSFHEKCYSVELTIKLTVACDNVL